MGTRDRNPSDTASAHGSTGDGATPQSPSAVDAEAELEIRPGDCLGRYTVRAFIGAGAMGRVYAAFDPELGRTVALKVMRYGRAPASPRARARLLREAQALARLHHPNVVTVHDVGTHDDEIFIAMELVEGPTLTEWLRAGEHGWREVLEHFLGAGRGLAAAHAAGIVHRDFKPENVIVGDGRVVVVDFGLARAGADEPSAGPPAPSPDQLGIDITATGHPVGTAAYMAPEQRAGSPLTARADQFSFAVALWEGLHGERPPPGPSPEGARRADVPARVNAALRRALAPDPDARWPSMDALLRALARDPAAARRRIALTVAMVALAVAAVWGLGRSPAADPCAGSAARFAGVWDATKKETIGKAFAAASVPYGEDAWQRARQRIDEYAAGWVDMHGEACRATRIEGRQSEALMDLRMACLESRRAGLAALTDLWARGMDAEAVAAAIDAARSLPPVAACADTRVLTERVPLPADPARRASIAVVRAHVFAVNALTMAHRWPEARERAAAARAEADATGWPGVRAEATFAEAEMLLFLGDASVESRLVDAARVAGEARNDALAARALVELVSHLADRQAQAPRAHLAADIAAGVVARAGDDRQSAVLLATRGQVFLGEGKLDEARAAFSEARARLTSAFGADDKDTLWAVTNLGRVAARAGDYDQAQKLFEETLPRLIALLGDQHPQVANLLNSMAAAAQNAGDHEAAIRFGQRALAIAERNAPASPTTALMMNNLGAAELALGHVDGAQGLLERALALYERAYGPEHPDVAMTLINLADVSFARKRYEQAFDPLERARAIYTKSFGPTAAEVAVPLERIAVVLSARKDTAGALATFRRVLDIRTRALGSEHLLTLSSLTGVAENLVELGRCDEATQMLATAIAGLEKAHGAASPYVADALAYDARCDLAMGKPALAIERLERAFAIFDKSPQAGSDRGTDRWYLARALWTSGRREAAMAAAHQAEDELAKSDDDDDADARRALQAWLAKHRR